MATDLQAIREDWFKRVQNELYPRLFSDARFPDAGKLIARLEQDVETSRKNGDFEPVIQIANELAAADRILTRLQADDVLRYEPPISGTEKRLDFLRTTAKGEREWIEVKTVAPQWKDDDDQWEKYLLIAAEFPENAKLGVGKEWAGAAIAGQEMKARLSFVNNAIQTEERAALIPETERGPVTLVLCSSGSWHCDALEDFADFYRTGKFRQDDWSRAALTRFMSEEKKVLNRTLSGFHFLARKHEEVQASDFRICVGGPKFGA